MTSIVRHGLLPFFALATVLFGIPLAQAAPQPSISMVDVRTFDPETFRFPSGPAFSFHPGMAIVAQGGTVDFFNHGFEPHTVTSYTHKMTVEFEGINVSMPIPDGKFNSGIATPLHHGDTWTLDTSTLAAGDYKYFCLIHPWMQAVLRIVESGASTSITVAMDHHLGRTSQFFSGSASWGFTPRSLTVKQGTSITVTDKGILPHTFTSYTDTITFGDEGRTITIPIPDGTFNSGIKTPGQTYTLNTSGLNKGTYTYFCAIHPWMLGSITVA